MRLRGLEADLYALPMAIWCRQSAGPLWQIIRDQVTDDIFELEIFYNPRTVLL